MPQIPVPATYRVVATSLRGSEQIVNVYHVSQAVVGQPERDAVVAAFETFYTGLSGAAVGSRGINSLIDNGVMLDAITIQSLTLVPYTSPWVYSIGVSGTVAADSLPLQSTINVLWRTSISDRNFRGRTQLGGFTIQALDDAASASNPIVEAATLTAVGNAITDLFANIADAGVELVVASLYDGIDAQGKPIPRDEGETMPILSAKVANKFGSLRKRANRQLATDNVVITAP